MPESNKKIRPLADYLLVEPLKKDTTLPSGIVIPDTAQEKPQEGKVIATGPGRMTRRGERIPIEVKVGDIVIFKKWGGTDIKIEGREALLVKEEDILAIVES